MGRISVDDFISVEPETARGLLKRIGEERKKMEDHVHSMEGVKNNIHRLYTGDGANEFNKTSTVLNKAVAEIIDLLRETEVVLEQFVEKTVDTDNNNRRGFGAV